MSWAAPAITGCVLALNHPSSISAWCEAILVARERTLQIVSVTSSMGLLLWDTTARQIRREPNGAEEVE
eukprot:4687805-Amphidinium_carterae.1